MMNRGLGKGTETGLGGALSAAQSVIFSSDRKMRSQSYCQVVMGAHRPPSCPAGKDG